MEVVDAKEWKAALAEVSICPDVINLRKWYKAAVIRFSKNLGLLLILISLKLPAVRDVYMAILPTDCTEVNEETIFDVCSRLCAYFGSHNDKLVKSSQEVGGPLKAHGFIVQMLHFFV